MIDVTQFAIYLNLQLESDDEGKFTIDSMTNIMIDFCLVTYS